MDEWQITTERVDDILLLIALMYQMVLAPLLDQFFPTYGNCSSLSPGWVTTLRLAHLLSEGDHRLSHAPPWTRRECLWQRRSCSDSGLMVPLPLSASVAGQRVSREARRLVVRSVGAAWAQAAALRQRLVKAQAALVALNERKRGKRRFCERGAPRHRQPKPLGSDMEPRACCVCWYTGLSLAYLTKLP